MVRHGTFLFIAAASVVYVHLRTSFYYMDRNNYDNVSLCNLIDINNLFIISKQYPLVTIKKGRGSK
jgi:hypothetical protein